MSLMTGIALEQTNNRAELLAAITAMRVQDGNLEIRSDSDHVVRIATRLLQGESQLNNEGDADLWHEFVTELRLKATEQLSFVWIKGHSMQLMGRKGPVNCSKPMLSRDRPHS